MAAQKVMKNNNGEVIVKYDDGSWRYYDPKDPEDISLLEEQNRRVRARNEEKRKRMQEANVKRNGEEENAEPKIKKKKSQITKTKKYKSKKPKKNKGMIAKAKKNKNKAPKTKKNKSKTGKVGLAKKKKKSKSKVPAVYTGKNYREDIKRIIIQTRDQKIKVSDRERKALFLKNSLSDKIAVAKKRKEGKMKIKSLENKLAIAKIDLKEAGKKSKSLTKKRKAYSKILNEDPYAQSIMYNKLARKFGENVDTDQAAYATEENPKQVENPSSNSKKGLKNMKLNLKSNSNKTQTPVITARNASAAWPQKIDLTKNPPRQECSVSFEGIDSFSGKKRKDLSSKLLFSYTDPRMQKFFTQRDMLECNAHLSAVAGGNVFLSLNITIATETAKTSYGAIERGSLLSLKMVNGENINMTNNQTDPGFLDPIAKTTSYKVTYLIPTQHVKTLQKMEIDLLRIVWETGYEDYEIYETDFIIEQMNCLQK